MNIYRLIANLARLQSLFSFRKIPSKSHRTQPKKTLYLITDKMRKLFKSSTHCAVLVYAVHSGQILKIHFVIYKENYEKTTFRFLYNLKKGLESKQELKKTSNL